MAPGSGARRLALTMAVFAAAAGVNTASVAVQRRTGLFTRLFGRAGWYAHLGLVLPIWAVLLALLPGLNRAIRWPLPWRGRRAGSALIAGSAVIWLLAYRQLGPIRTANGDVFGRVDRVRVKTGPFRVVRNPMYVSYALALAGRGLQSGNGVYLLLAAESFLLLNEIEARVENAAPTEPPRRTSDDRLDRDVRDEGLRGGRAVPRHT